MVPRVAARKTHQRPSKFSFFTPKRLLQQYLPKAEYPNSPYSLLRAIRPRRRSRHLAVLAQPVQGLMLTEAAQFEMADFKCRCRNFCGKSTSHEQWPANILAEEFQPAEDIDVAPDGGEVEAIARANIAVCGITIVQSNIDGNMLLDLRR
jgi:hypothetical protein